MLTVLTAQAVAAQPVEELFVHRAAASSAAQSVSDGRGAISSRASVGLRLDVLFDGADGAARTIRLNVGSDAWTARFERSEIDRLGFRTWVGRLDEIPESHVVFAERDGIVSGLINAVGRTYQVRTLAAGSYVLEGVDTSLLGDEPDPQPDGASTADPAAAISAAADDATVIDVLMLYTPAARLQRGGSLQMEALASQVISDTNTAFGRSGIVPRLRLVGVREFALTEGSQMAGDLNALRSSSDARALRDGARADLVQLLVSSPDLTACGVGYLLTTLTTSFDAYSVADVACAAQYTPSHEMGHNMGAHHAPEDGASGALTPYSYGYKDPLRGFRTIMAYSCLDASCPRIPNFSNPNVTHNGVQTGTGTQYNARSINEAALTVANFRQSTPSLALPSAPTGLTSSVVGNNVTVAWTPVASAMSYVLQVGSSPGLSNLFSGTIGPAASATGIVGVGTYFWRVIAVNSIGASPPSAESQFSVAQCQPPSAPTNFSFSLAARNVTLSWNTGAPGPAATGYILEAGSAPGTADLLVLSLAPVSALEIVAPPGAYYVRLRAQNACGTSAPSNEQRIVVP